MTPPGEIQTVIAQHQPSCSSLRCGRCGSVAENHQTWGHDWQDQACSCRAKRSASHKSHQITEYLQHKFDCAKWDTDTNGLAVFDVIREDVACTCGLEEALRAVQPPPEQKCRVCGGSGFVAQKQSIDDGYGEVDSCPACEPAPPLPAIPRVP